jgi:hypothetical protein
LTSGKPKTFYIPNESEQQWTRYIYLCDIKLNTSASKRINTLWQNDLSFLEGKEVQAPGFNIDAKIMESINLQKKRTDIHTLLNNVLLTGSRVTPFEKLVNLSIGFGTDVSLSKNIPIVKQKLLEYKIRTNDGFNNHHRVLFIAFLELTLKRQLLTEEIEKNMVVNCKVQPTFDNSEALLNP